MIVLIGVGVSRLVLFFRGFWQAQVRYISLRDAWYLGVCAQDCAQGFILKPSAPPALGGPQSAWKLPWDRERSGLVRVKLVLSADLPPFPVRWQLGCPSPASPFSFGTVPARGTRLPCPS